MNRSHAALILALIVSLVSGCGSDGSKRSTDPAPVDNGGGGSGGEGDGGEPIAETPSWAVRAGGPLNDIAYSVSAFPDLGGATTGFFIERAVFGPGEQMDEDGAGETQLVAFRDADIFFSRFNADGSLRWAKLAGGDGIDVGYSVDALPSLRSSYTGCFDSTATWGPGEVNETVYRSRGLSDIFAAKLRPDGTLIWAKQAGGENFDIGYGASNVGEEAVLITGQFRGVATFGPGEPGAVDLGSRGSADIFLARLDGATGDLQWAVQAGGGDFDRAQDVAAYADGSSIVTGLFRTVSTWGRGDDAIELQSNGFTDGFLARHRPDGSVAWVQRFGGGGLDAGRAVDIVPDGSGDFCAVGYFERRARFGNDPQAPVFIDARGTRDIWAAKYRGDGELLWVRAAGGPDRIEEGDTQIEEQQGDQALGVDANADGGCLVTGTFDQRAVFGSGAAEVALEASIENDAFLAYYDRDGVLGWARSDGGGSVDVGFEVSWLDDGSLLGVGGFALDLEFGGGGPTLRTADNFIDIFVQRSSGGDGAF